MKTTNLQKVESLSLYFQKSYLQICGVLLTISFLLFISITALSRSSLLFQVFFFLPYFVYILSLYLVRRYCLFLNKTSLVTIIFITSIIQVLLLTQPITLSDDVYRYFLEGKAILNGINPYQIPLSDLPAYITKGYLAKANNTSLVSPYPPLALFIFLVMTILFDNPLSFRIIFSFTFILVVLGLAKLLGKENQWKIVVFAWNPLLLLETVSGSHFEALIVLFLTIGLIAIEHRNSVFAAICFIGAFFLKYYTILFIILYWNKFTKLGKGLISLSLTLYSLWIFFDPIIIQGLVQYTTEWYFNASVVWLISETILPLIQSKIVLETVFVVIFGVLAVKALKSKESPHETAGLVMGIFLLLQSTFHPWYIFWIFPFILLDSPKVFWSWIALSGLLVLSYDVYILFDQGAIWNESTLIRILEYASFLLLFVLETVYNDRREAHKASVNTNDYDEEF
jgi:alpha-1,6-mannosyltransferase